MRKRLPAVGLGVTALLQLAALTFTAMLPSECGQIGRPNVDFAARATIVTAIVALIGAGISAVWARPLRAQAVILAVFAVVGTGALVALVVFYKHQTAWYDHCD